MLDKLKVDIGVKHAFRNPTDKIVKVFIKDGEHGLSRKTDLNYYLPS